MAKSDPVQDARAALKQANRDLASAAAMPPDWKMFDQDSSAHLLTSLSGRQLRDASMENLMTESGLQFAVRRPTPTEADQVASGARTAAAKEDVQAAAKNLEEEKRKMKQEWGRKASTSSAVFLVVLGLLGVAAWFWGWGTPGAKADNPQQYVALAWAAPATAGILILVGLTFVGRDGGGIVGLVVGTDNRYSTSLIQVLLWTMAVVFAFIMFIALVAQKFTFSDSNGFNSFDETYLFLLGGPFAAALAAKFTATTKTADETVQQTKAVVPSRKDVVTDHSGATSLTDTQFFLFNVVALGYFGVAFAHDPTTLPTLNMTLVGLTSVSALTYVGGKVVNSNPPTISSVSILSGAVDGKLVPGTSTVRIVGKNFQPSGTDEFKDLDTAVLFGSTEVLVLERTSDSELHATVPANLPAGPVDITVRTAEGSTATPWKGLEVNG